MFPITTYPSAWDDMTVDTSDNPSTTMIPSKMEEDAQERTFWSYINGLFASQGEENKINREYNSAEALKNRQFQSAEAQIQRDWYEAMSNSAYQRAVADMKKAGINPILAYQQGGAAASGTGIATGSAAAYTATGGDRLSDILSSIADLVAANKSKSNSSNLSGIIAIIKALM